MKVYFWLFAIINVAHTLSYAQQDTIIYDPIAGDYIFQYYWVDYDTGLRTDSLVTFTFVPETKINPTVNTTVTIDSCMFSYHYKIANGADSKQNLFSFDIQYGKSITIADKSTNRWRAMNTKGFRDESLNRIWCWAGHQGLEPTWHTDGFILVSDGLPSIGTSFFSGLAPIPRYYTGMPVWMEKRYHDDLRSFPNNTVKRETVVPGAFLIPFLLLDFLDTLIGYTTQSRSLEWIKDQPTADKYLSYFDSARTSLQQDSLYAAHKILQRVLQDVDIDSTANITSEAYALLRYNTEYLIDHLPQVTAIMIAQNWNLVSVPLLQSDYSANVVFPGKFGDMFGYNTSLDNYEIADTLLCGAGYWVNYQTSGSVVISGMVPETVSVGATQEGWVLIGSHHTPVQVSALVLSDGAVINGAAYRYNPATGAYESTPVLTPGEGHWLNVNKACTITFP